MARFLETHFTHAQLDDLFLRTSISETTNPGSNKLARCVNVLKGLAQSAQTEQSNSLDELFDQVLSLRKHAFELNSWSSEREEIPLILALKADGYIVLDGKIASSDMLERELVSEVSLLEQRLDAHGMLDVLSTLNQA